jgi:hypothetical protein
MITLLWELSKNILETDVCTGNKISVKMTHFVRGT